MKKIWKFPFYISDEIEIEMPEHSKILHVECQGGKPCIWAEVNPDNAVETRKFYIAGTGHNIPDRLNDIGHIATFQRPPFVWHLYGTISELN